MPFSQSLDVSGGEGKEEEEEDGEAERGRDKEEEEEREGSTNEEVVMEVEDDVSEREETHMDVSPPHPPTHSTLSFLIK